MKVLLIATLISFTTFAGEPKEMPTDTVPAHLAVLDTTPVFDIRPIQAGEVSPVTGRVMSTETYILIAQRVTSAETERDALRTGGTKLSGPAWLLLGFIATAATAGGVYLGVKLKGAAPGL